MAAGKRDAVTTRRMDVTDGLTADAALGPVPARWDADRAVTVMFGEHYRSLARIAALLVGDVATAEAVVQESFVAMHGVWRRLGDSEKALPYLRQCLVNRSRSVLRHRVAMSRNTSGPKPSMPRCGAAGAALAGACGGGGVAGAAAAATGGACADLLRRPDRSAGRLGHADQPGCGEEPPGPGG